MLNLRRIVVRSERLIYRIAALPIAFRAHFFRSPDMPALELRRAVARRFWHAEALHEGAELVAALLLWPVALIGAMMWFTARNGGMVSRRDGRPILAQCADQLRLYFSAGILAPWYYIFSLYDDGDSRAPTFLQRAETKWGVYLLLRPAAASPLGKKKAFADRCAEHGVRCVPDLLSLDPTDGPRSDLALPDRDLFVKPARGRGGRGAERWDRVGPFQYKGPDDEALTDRTLIERLASRARGMPLLVQPRLEPHSSLADLTAGALPTARLLTCLDERANPEVMAAVFRMSIGVNRTVDNIHAGGIACGIELGSGMLGKASNLGSDARLGWLSRHPDTGAVIEGRSLPFWPEVKALAVLAHQAFADRIMIGWDLAILEDGPIVIEGNGGPDMDLMQRFMRTGFCRHRFADLLTFHLRQRGLAA